MAREQIAIDDRQPLVSVIVPAWNAEDTLGETLRSAGSQTYRNLEIIIVDDGSTDATSAIASGFCANDPRARLLRKDNGGVASARNFGIENARGEWVAPLDADDLWHPTKIEKQVRAALDAPSPPGMVYCWYHSIDEQGDVLGSGPRWSFSGAAIRRMAYVNPVQNGSALLICREAAIRAGGFDASLRAAGNEGCEDVMIQFAIARHHPVAVVPEHLVGYRKRMGSMSRDTDMIIRSWTMVYDWLRSQNSTAPRHVFEWSGAFGDTALAEQAAVSGSFGNAIRLLTSAFRRDPARTAAFLTYRLTRTAVRVVRGRRPVHERISFSDMDSRAFISFDADELPRLRWLLIDRLDEARIRRLERGERLEPIR